MEAEVLNTTTFITKYPPNHRITVLRPRSIHAPSGDKIGEWHGAALEFEGPVAVVEERRWLEERKEKREQRDEETGRIRLVDVEIEEDMVGVFCNGKNIQPPDLVHPDEPILTYDAFLARVKSRPGFNVEFFEQGNAPDEPKPTKAERQQAISKAIAAGDAEALLEIRADEESTHNREDVLQSVDAGLEAIAEAAAPVG